MMDVDIWSIVYTLTVSGKAKAKYEFFIDKNINELPLIQNITLSTTSTGGNIPRNSKVYVRVTSVDANGLESPPTDTCNCITVGSTTDTNKITVTIGAVTGAVSYNVYTSLRPSMETIYGSFTGTSFIITELPVNDYFMGMPTNPDFIINSAGVGTETLGLTSPFFINNRLIIYVTPSIAGSVACSLFLG